MEKTNLENLNKLAKLFGTDRLISPEEIQEIRGVLVGVLANNKKELESLTAETRELVNKVLNKVLDEHDTYLEKSKQIVQEAKSDTTEAIQATMKSLEEVKKLCKEVMECKPENGKDADEEYVIGEVLNRIKLPEYKEVVLDDGGAIVDKINSLPVNEENQIDAKHIKNLPEVKGGRVISGGVTRKIVQQMIDQSGAAGIDLEVEGTPNVDQGTLNLVAGTNMTITDNGDGSVTFDAAGGGGGSGDVVGPASATDNAVARYDSTTGKLIQNSGVTISDTNVITTAGTIDSSLTASEILGTNGSKQLVSLAVATYPSLTELTYVKGVTSAIQTQINTKAPSTSPTFATSVTGSYLTASEMLITDVSKNIVSAPVATYPSLTELTYVKGATSAIQTQLNAKQSTITFGTGVETALGVNVGTAGSPVVNGGALGTPSSGTVTNLTGTASININGTVGATTPTTGVFTTLVAGSTTSLLLGTAGSAVGNIGFRNATSGTITLAPVTGALGTVTLSLPAATDTLVGRDTTDTLTNKTLTSPTLTTPALGTPSSGTLTNCTGLPVAGITSSTSTALGVGSLELGNASDTTLSRSAAGTLAVEGIRVQTTTPLVVSAASYTTDTGSSLNMDNLDMFIVTAQAGALLFNAPGGTLVQGRTLVIRIKDNGTARALTWNSVFRAMGTALPSTTVLSKTLYLGFFYNSTDTKWDLVASAQEA